MYSVLKSYGLNGLNGFAVAVEADVSGGLPAFSLVGLPDSAVRESGEMCAFQAELTVAVNQAFLYSDSNNIRKEHIMRSERNDLCHPALQ